MRTSFSEILRAVDSKKTFEERVQHLQSYHRFGQLKHLLRIAFDPNVKWLVKTPRYKPCPYLDQQSMLFAEARRLYLFIEGGNPNLEQKRRDVLFIQLLESLDPEDAVTLIAMKDKKLPFKYITRELVDTAFPGLI